MTRTLGAGRWGLLVVAIIASVVLVSSAFVNRRAVDTLAWTSARGQAVMLDRILQKHLEARPADQATLDAYFAENEECGLRYVSLSGPDGEILDAGAAFGGVSAGPADQSFELIEGRARVHLEAPDASEGRLVLEYEPVYWQKLRAQADLQLLWSVLASLALLVGAAVLRRMAMRADAAVAEAERNKHLASLGEMTAILAHEIRNPLTSLKGHAQLLAEQPLEPKAHERADRVVDEATRLESLTRNLLNFVRSGKIEPTNEDPTVVARAAAAAVDGADVTVDSAEAPAKWPLDRLKVQQALSNLLRNAAEANAENGTDESIVLEVFEQDDQLVYSVGDRGPGFSPDARARLFEPFFTTKTQGTGLGLAVAQRVVTLHGGRIEVAERPGGGSLFQTWIPLSQPSGGA